MLESECAEDGRGALWRESILVTPIAAAASVARTSAERDTSGQR